MKILNTRFQLQQVKNLEVIASILPRRKSWTNWKSITCLGLIKELRLQHKLSLWHLEKHSHPRIVRWNSFKHCWSHTLQSTLWWSFWELLVAGRRLAWEWKMPGDLNLSRLPFSGSYLQQPNRSSFWRLGKNTSILQRVDGKGCYPCEIFPESPHNKALHSGGEPYSCWGQGEDMYIIPALLAFLSQLTGAGWRAYSFRVWDQQSQLGMLQPAKETPGEEKVIVLGMHLRRAQA